MTRRILLFLALFFFALSPSVYATDCCGTRWDEAEYSPAACAGCGEDSAFTVEAELLILDLCRSELDYAISGETNAVVYTDAGVAYVDPDWELGLRLKGNYCSCDDGWEYALQYTHYSAAHSSSITRSTGGTSPAVLPTRIHPAVLGAARSANSANATFDLDYDVIDFIASRPWFVSCSYLLRPYAGVRYLMLDQDFRVSYTGVDLTPNAASSHWKSDYDALGMTGGFEYYHSWFDFCDGVFATFGRFGSSLLVGKADSHLSQVPGVAVGTNTLSVHDEDDCVVVSGIDFMSGVSWEACQDWCGCCSYLHVRLGGETTLWNNTPQQRRGYDLLVVGPHSSASSGTLALTGFFAALAVGF
jgi:hypothetical protein